MKNYLLLFPLLCAVALFAQKNDNEYSFATYKSGNPVASFAKVYAPEVTTAESAAQWLTRNLPYLKTSGAGCLLNYVNESPGGFHYSFHQTYKGVEVYQSEIKLNIDRHHVIRSVFDNSENTEGWNVNTDYCNREHVIALRDGVPVVCVLSIEDGHIETLRADGEVIFSRDLNMYFAAPDSVVSAKVFNPDPLTTAQQNYAAPYNDNNDATNAQLDAELQTVNFTATFNGSVFRLENQYVRILDFDAPTIAPVTSTTPQFYFDRSQSGFEDANAFYHINMQRSRVHSLSFNTADFLVDVDPHAFGGADNSAFSYFSNPPNIKYGTGGVDDAEDADVVIHEYAHFISYNAAPGSNIDSQRNSLDEGFGDYLAATYSDNLSSFKREEVFSWDGHNQFWSGRVVNTTRKYPADLQSGFYKNAEMWSAALWDIYNEIGRDATDSLILQAHYSYAQSILMSDGAQLLLDADSLLTNGHYHCPVYKHLYWHGFVPFDPNNPCGISSVTEETESGVQFWQNAKSFTCVNETGKPFLLQLYAVSGQLIFSKEEKGSRVDYENENLAAGVYLVVVSINGNKRSFKWAKAD